jgi:hypothetical protein
MIGEEHGVPLSHLILAENTVHFLLGCLQWKGTKKWARCHLVHRIISMTTVAQGNVFGSLVDEM